MKKKINKASPAYLGHVARWRGTVEGCRQNMLYGWAVDTLQPQARVVLEILLYGEVAGSVVADIARSDLHDDFAAVLGDEPAADDCHGFVFDLGAHAGPDTLFTARVANTDSPIDGVVAGGDGTVPIGATSIVFGDGGVSLHGWVVGGQPAVPTRVRAYLDTRLLAETIADRNAAVASFIARPADACSFMLELPPDLADGRAHAVRVVDGNGAALNGSPVTVCCQDIGPRALVQESPALLAEVIANYERYLPRSLGLRYYRQWCALFDDDGKSRTQSALVVKPSPAPIGVVITGAGARDAIGRTRASLGTRPDMTVLVAADIVDGDDPDHLTYAAAISRLLVHCTYVATVRAGDTVMPHALDHALEGFRDPDTQAVYTDSEFQGIPWFKPAWNPEYAYCSDYPLELMVIRAEFVSRMAAAEGLPDHYPMLAWRTLEQLSLKAGQAIVHVPRVLYCYQSVPDTAELARRSRAAAEALIRQQPHAVLEELAPGDKNRNGSRCLPFQPRRLRRALTSDMQQLTVSLIIPTRDRTELLKDCLDSLRTYTEWPRLEIIVIDNGSVLAASKAYLRKISRQGIRVLSMPGPFNFSDINNRAVALAGGEIIGLVNNDIQALHSGWLDEMLSHLLLPGVGAVGAKLLWPNGMVQHGGVLLGMGNLAGHFGNRLNDNDWGDHGRNQLLQQVSAVTAACLLLRREDYLAVGGMDAHSFPVAFNDVDLCLKLRAAGKTIVWTPHARLLHAESASRGREDSTQKRARAHREADLLRRRWGADLLNDPNYHPSLALDVYNQAYGALALPPRSREPRGTSLPVIAI